MTGTLEDLVGLKALRLIHLRDLAKAKRAKRRYSHIQAELVRVTAEISALEVRA